MVGGGYCGLQMPLPALAARETVAGRRLGALEGGGGLTSPLPVQPWGQDPSPLFHCTRSAVAC